MGDLPAENNQELMASNLKHRLEGWREVILPLNNVLLWKNPWHTVILFASVSYIFFLGKPNDNNRYCSRLTISLREFWMIWWCDLSMISLFSIIGAIVTLIDYIGPIALRTISDPAQWNSKKEKTFDEICQSIVSIQISWNFVLYWISELKTNQQLLYYLASVISLLTLAFIGQVIDNLLLTYLLVMVLLLIPGVRHNNPIKSCISLITGSSGPAKKGKNKGN